MTKMKSTVQNAERRNTIEKRAVDEYMGHSMTGFIGFHLFCLTLF